MGKMSKRQQQIVDTAISIIAGQGIQHLTTKNLAGAIGISEAALYRHFSSKHEILLAVLDVFREYSAFDIKENYAGMSSLDLIWKFLEDRYRKFQANPELTRVMFSEEVFQYDRQLSEKVLEIMHIHQNILVDIITEGQLRGEIRSDLEVRPLFRIIIGSMRLLVEQWCLTGYGFELFPEGQALWFNLQKMLR